EHPDRHIEPPNIINSTREAPHVVPQPNPVQEAEHERARQAHEAQRQAEAQARALREQQNAQPHQAPLKQVAPPAAITPSQPVHEERRHHQQENAPAEIHREERPAGAKEGNEIGGRPDRRDNFERR
ncbi:MAG: hypothetical protein ACXWJK_12605, partial [Burkholderiaceae bacterium]